jgi:hypothetical protein
VNDERLADALKSAMEQVEEKGAPYTGLLRQLQELDASRGKGELSAEVREKALEAIEEAPPVLLKPEERGSGLGTSDVEGAEGPSPLAELQQVLIDLRTARS